MASPATPLPKPTPEQQAAADALLKLLARSDTLHDFEGATDKDGKIILTKKDVLDILDDIKLEGTFELHANKLRQNLSNIKDCKNVNVNPKNIEDILQKSCAALVSINYPQNVSPRIIDRIKNLKSFEPRVVLFFELYEDFLKKSYPQVNMGKYISYEYLAGYSFVAERYTFDAFGGNKEDTEQKHELFKTSHISYINLGKTAKNAINDDKGQTAREGRAATGIYTLDTEADRFKALSPILAEFFGGQQDNLYFFIDATSISLTELGIDQNTKFVCSIASDWDSATKAKCVYAENELVVVNTDLLEKTVFGIDDLQLKSTKSTNGIIKKEAVIKKKEISRKYVIGKTAVVINDLAECIRTLLDAPPKKNAPQKNITIKCYNGNLDLHELFDIKRTGDSYQVLSTKRIQANYDQEKNKKIIFVTTDNLAFLKARLNGVNAIFTSIDKGTHERIMFLYKAQFDEKAVLNILRRQCIETFTRYNRLCDAVNRLERNVFTSVEEKLKVIFGEELPISRLAVQEGTTFGKLELSRDFFYRRIPYSLREIDELIKLDKVISLNKSIINFQSICDQISDNIRGLTINNNVLSMLQTKDKVIENIYKIINHTFYIEVFYKLRKFLIGTYEEVKAKMIQDITNIAGLTMSEGYISLNELSIFLNPEVWTEGDIEKRQEYLNYLLQEVKKFIEKYKEYEHTDGNNVFDLLQIDIKGYEAIMTKISQLIGSQLYKPEEGIVAKIAKAEEIGASSRSASASTSRPASAAATRAVDRQATLKSSAYAYIIDKLINERVMKPINAILQSFAVVQTNFLVYDETEYGDAPDLGRIIDGYIKYVDRLAGGAPTEPGGTDGKSAPQPAQPPALQRSSSGVSDLLLQKSSEYPAEPASDNTNGDSSDSDDEATSPDQSITPEKIIAKEETLSLVSNDIVNKWLFDYINENLMFYRMMNATLDGVDISNADLYLLFDVVIAAKYDYYKKHKASFEHNICNTYVATQQSKDKEAQTKVILGNLKTNKVLTDDELYTLLMFTCSDWYLRTNLDLLTKDPSAPSAPSAPSSPTSPPTSSMAGLSVSGVQDSPVNPGLPMFNMTEMEKPLYNPEFDGGAPHAFPKYTLRDYCAKYYKPYYDLYYKK